MGYCVKYCQPTEVFMYCDWMPVLLKWNKLCEAVSKNLLVFLKSPLFFKKPHCFQRCALFIPYFWNETKNDPWLRVESVLVDLLHLGVDAPLQQGGLDLALGHTSHHLQGHMQFYRYNPKFSDTLCFRTPPIFHRNNYFLDAQKHVFRTPFVFGHPYFSPK